MSFQVQHQIRTNATEIRSYVQDLYDWEESVNDAPIKVNKTPQAPIRGQVTEMDKPLKRDTNNIKDYYNAWSKVDIDKMLSEDGNTDGNDIFKQSESRPNAKIVIKGGRQQQAMDSVMLLKEKGNEQFKQAKYNDAIVFYTDGVNELKQKSTLNSDELDQLVILQSNRAQCHLKLMEYMSALVDCTEALKLNQNHAKTLLRRSTALQSLGRWREALRDSERILVIDPTDQDAMKVVQLLKSKLEKKKQAAYNVLRQVKPMEQYELVFVEDIAANNNINTNYLNQLDD